MTYLTDDQIENYITTADLAQDLGKPFYPLYPWVVRQLCQEILEGRRMREQVAEPKIDSKESNPE